MRDGGPRRSAVLALAGLLGACMAGADPIVEPSASFPTGFTPAPPLNDPPAGDPAVRGARYLEAIAPALASGWAAFLEDCRLRLPPGHPLNRPDLVAELALRIAPDGRLVGAALAAPSGVSELDRVALTIAREARYPAPPDELVSDDGLVHLRWQFARDRRQAGVVGARVEDMRWPLDQAVPRLVAAGRLHAAAERVAEAAGLPDGQRPDAAVLHGHLEAIALAAARASLDPSVASLRPRRAMAAIRLVAEGRVNALADEVARLAGGVLDPAVRVAAILALGELGDRRAAPVLVGVLDAGARGGPEAVAAAAAALTELGLAAQVGVALGDELGGADERARFAALAALANAPDAGAVPTLVGLFGDGSKAERLAAALALGMAAPASPEAAHALIGGLSLEDPALRAAAAQGLAIGAAGGLRHDEAYRALVRRLADRDERVRSAAVTAAARLHPERLVRDLPRLARERSATVEIALAEALGPIAGAAPRRRLEGLARSRNPGVRQAAERALCGRGEREVAAACAALARGEADLTVRLAAVAWVDHADLQALLADPHPEIRAAALGRLLDVGGVSPVALTARVVAAAPPDDVAGLLALSAWLSRVRPASAFGSP